MAEVLPGAEPFHAGGGPHGVLVLHGFTGSPHSILGLAEAFAAAGFAVDAPLLPGHGTTIDDMLATRWLDWSGAAEQAYLRLAGAVPGKVVVAGLSMGGTLAAWLAARHPEIAAIVVVNPYIDPPAREARDTLRRIAESGFGQAPGFGHDVADPEAHSVGYDETPIEPLLSLCSGIDEVFSLLPEITCPSLVFTSRVDHVVDPISSDVFASRVSGPIERVWLERSYHVATLDRDRAEIEQRAVAFARKVASG